MLNIFDFETFKREHMINETKGRLSEDDSDNIYIDSHDLRLPWDVLPRIQSQV